MPGLSRRVNVFSCALLACPTPRITGGDTLRELPTWVSVPDHRLELGKKHHRQLPPVNAVDAVGRGRFAGFPSANDAALQTEEKENTHYQAANESGDWPCSEPA
jgi:hypothetical protein